MRTYINRRTKSTPPSSTGARLCLHRGIILCILDAICTDLFHHIPKGTTAMKHGILVILLVSLLMLLAACSSLRIESVEYGWPVESVLTVSDANTIDEGRYILSCRVSQIASEEFQDSTALRGAKLRLIRSSEGYYFLTGPRFKNVYVFESGPATLSLKTKIEVSKTGLTNPALNQRAPYIELLDGESYKRLLSSDDIVEGKKK